MDSITIPEQLQSKLAAAGYTRDNLPNTRETKDWSIVQTDCNFSNPELIQLKNVLFPTPLGIHFC
jgi:hypothetical protein